MRTRFNTGDRHIFGADHDTRDNPYQPVLALGLDLFRIWRGGQSSQSK
jgi:hypothetical protein